MDLNYNDCDLKSDENILNNEKENISQKLNSRETIEEKSKSQVFTHQDIIDQDFPEIAKLGIVQFSGDDRAGKIGIIFYACRIPSIKDINLNNLWEYIVKTMERFVSNDYSLIYFHYGLTNRNNPGIKFLLKVYRQIDRDYKKNLKNIFIVHPSAMVKVIITALLPFFSQKVKNKIIKIEKLKDLDAYFYLDQILIPDMVRQHDSRVNVRTTVDRGLKRTGDFLVYYSDLLNNTCPKAQFGVSLEQVRDVYPDHLYPPVMEQCIDYLRKECLECEGIFRRSSSKILLDDVQKKFNMGENVDLYKYQNPHLTACLLKTFLRSLKEPLMTFDLYDDIIKIHNMTIEESSLHIKFIVTQLLPDFNYRVLKHLLEFLKEVAEFSEKNKMTIENLANVFAPNLSWSRNESSITTIHTIIKFTLLLLQNADIIFIKEDSF